MKFFTPRAQSGPADAPQIFARLNELVGARTAGGVQDIRADNDRDDLDQQIADHMESLSAGGSLLNWFLAGAMQDRRLPDLAGAQSYFVFDGEFLAARINLWPPYSDRVGNSEAFRRYLSIEELHNHDFSFYTCCLLGSGYTSHFYRDAAFDPGMNVGDRPVLDDLGTISLAPGRTLLVDAFVDYHTQHWPEDFSVTLNLIPKVRKKDINVQYILDSETFRIKTVADSTL